MELSRIYNGPKITFGLDGPSYTALLYAKMKGETKFTSRDLSRCMAGKFKSVDSATKALKVLESNRCVHRIDTTTWVISKIGMEVVRQVGIARKSPLFSRGFG